MTRRRVLMVISDGDDNVGQWQEPLAEVIRRRIKLYAIGLGTATGAVFPLARTPGGDVLRYALSGTGERIVARAQWRTLRDVAERTGARFYRGEDDRQVDAAVDEVLVTGRPVVGYQADPVTRDLSFPVLGAAFLCLIGGIFA